MIRPLTGRRAASLFCLALFLRAATVNLLYSLLVGRVSPAVDTQDLPIVRRFVTATPATTPGATASLTSGAPAGG